MAQLVTKKHVKTVYCLVRASSHDTARDRVFTALAAKKIDLLEHGIKIVCFPSDLSRDDLGLDKSTVHLLRKSLTTVIHCAWAVNFNLGVQSFEKQHIKGTYNLLNICLSVEHHHPPSYSSVPLSPQLQAHLCQLSSRRLTFLISRMLRIWDMHGQNWSRRQSSKLP